MEAMVMNNTLEIIIPPWNANFSLPYELYLVSDTQNCTKHIKYFMKKI